MECISTGPWPVANGPRRGHRGREDVLREAERMIETFGSKDPRRVSLDPTSPPTRGEVALALEGVAVVRLTLDSASRPVVSGEIAGGH
jgi:hypothetical protein